ncbi:MAG TPA: inorganic phosphate transporter [Thermomicrobiales bacterium]|nr:inorganic phosphate transporter [Thermomicrobiales bacterium]
MSDAGGRALAPEPAGAARQLVPTAPAPTRARLLPAGLGLLALGALVAARRLAPDGVAALGLGATLALAFANGANDVSKGIATLAGAGVADYGRATRWGGLWPGAGALAAAALARALVATFGAGFLAGGAGLGPAAALAVLLGALAWVLLATRTGLPVSTTHALAGAIVGVGVASVGAGGVAWGTLGRTIALPLLASPLLAVGLGLPAYALVRRLPARAPLGALHWLSSGATSFARGLNDTPKIVALGAGFAVGAGRAPWWAFLAIAAVMVAGSWAGGRRVTRTLAERVTRLDDREGLAANLATAALVGAASRLGLPVSTTHVASGAIAGVGARRGRRAVRWRTVGELALAWVVTLPVTALLAVAAYALVR